MAVTIDSLRGVSWSTAANDGREGEQRGTWKRGTFFKLAPRHSFSILSNQLAYHSDSDSHGGSSHGFFLIGGGDTTPAAAGARGEKLNGLVQRHALPLFLSFHPVHPLP